MTIHAEPFSLDAILEDIYNQLSEDGEAPLEDIQEELLDIAAHPINLNQTTADELSRLRFLSDEQIDAILLYQYEHPFQEIYELQLIDCLKDYEIRNLLPFVYVGAVDSDEKMYVREVFHYAKHEMTLRVDARNIEDYEGDPMYGKLRYRLNYQNRVQAGLTVSRAVGVPLKDIDLGGYVELRDMGPMKRIVAGNYQASFGYGLVVGSPFKRGKTAYLQSTATTDEGLKKYGSVGDSYNHFCGIGATAKVSSWADVSAFYSLRKGNEAWNHVVGVNATGRWNRLKVGVTAVEEIRPLGDEAKRLEARAVMGVNARWNRGKVDIWGELATSQPTQNSSLNGRDFNKWGIGGIAGIRYTPMSDINLLAIYRYYSPYFDNIYANALCSWTRMRDEHGGYLGVEYNRLKNWQLSAFGDVWKSGFETMAQADFIPQKDYRMHTRFRVKRKDEKDTYSLRWNMVYEVGQWKMKTQADGNLVYADDRMTYGWSLLQDVEYRFSQVPIVLQMRAQLFDAQKWDNRVYIYENDVLYAYAIPFVYGKGGRLWLNARYKINDTFSIYLRVSETIYQRAWSAANERRNHRTDVHALLRVKL
ncbi:MAG: helix-hairpin-helix domain-containing protein [Paludibacteraceae bacterium]|nr:helix-hairpin-helix domain-containing protein [Paludibacteraceae bacterium]